MIQIQDLNKQETIGCLKQYESGIWLARRITSADVSLDLRKEVFLILTELFISISNRSVELLPYRDKKAIESLVFAASSSSQAFCRKFDRKGSKKGFLKNRKGPDKDFRKTLDSLLEELTDIEEHVSHHLPEDAVAFEEETEDPLSGFSIEIETVDPQYDILDSYSEITDFGPPAPKLQSPSKFLHPDSVDSYSGQPCRYLPMTRVFFVGRQTLLSSIASFLERNRYLCVYGVPGVGTSETVNEYCHTLKDSQYDLVLWIDASSTQAVLESVRNISASLLGHPKVFLSTNESSYYLKYRLSERKCREFIKTNISGLVIMDNLPFTITGELWACIQEYAESELTNVVFVSKNRFESPFQFDSDHKTQGYTKDLSIMSIEVPPFNQEETEQYIRQKEVEIDSSNLEQIYNVIGGLPLALNIVVSFVREQFDGDVSKLLSKYLSLDSLEPDKFDFQQSLLRAFVPTLNRVRDSRRLTTFLRLLSNVPCAFPVKMFEKINPPFSFSSIETNIALNEFLRFSLLCVDSENMVHFPLPLATLIKTIDKNSTGLSLVAFSALVWLFKESLTNGDLDVCSVLAPGLARIFETNDDSFLRSNDGIVMLRYYGRYLFDSCAQLEDAERCLTMARENAFHQFGGLDPRVLDLEIDLGLVATSQKDFERAQLHLQRGLSGRIRKFGDSSREVAAVYICLGDLSAARSDLPQCHRWYLKARQIMNDDLTVQQNLGIIQLSLGHFHLARKALTWVREQKKLTGLESADIDAILGDVCRHIGDAVAAERLYESSMIKYRQILGIKHNRYLDVLRRFANLYRDSDRLTEALKMYSSALDSLKQPGVFMNDLLLDISILHSIAGDYAESLEISKQVLELEIVQGGIDQPRQVPILSCLAFVERSMGNLSESCKLYQKALRIQKKRFGLHNLNTAALQHGLSLVMFELGDRVSAEIYCRSSLSTIIRILGRKHSRVRQVVLSLAAIVEPSQRLDAIGILKEYCTTQFSLYSDFDDLISNCVRLIVAEKLQPSTKKKIPIDIDILMEYASLRRRKPEKKQAKLIRPEVIEACMICQRKIKKVFRRSCPRCNLIACPKCLQKVNGVRYCLLCTEVAV